MDTPRDIPTEAFETWKFMQTDPDFSDKTWDEQAAFCGVGRSTIARWRKVVDWEWIKSERRKRYASKIVEVDNAMFKAATRGDVAAAKIMYERFDGYVPISGTLNFHKETDGELLDMADKIKKELDAKRSGQDMPGAGPAQA